jgi:alanine racemase
MLHSFLTFLDNNGITQYPVHVEIETGMNRLGFSTGDIEQSIQQLQSPAFIIKSVFSHLVASEDPALDAFTQSQATTFEQICSLVSKHLPYPFLRHLLNSAGVFRHPGFQYDMVRIGIGLYGAGIPEMGLQPVSVLKSTIAQIKLLTSGESVSYGRSGVVTRHSVIATVRIGYADGYPRILGNGRGSMLVQGKLVPTIGQVCMDMTMIDITGVNGIMEGDEVIIFGRQLPVERVAAAANTIPYEILTGISQRVQRIYYEE